MICHPTNNWPRIMGLSNSKYDFLFLQDLVQFQELASVVTCVGVYIQLFCSARPFKQQIRLFGGHVWDDLKEEDVREGEKAQSRRTLFFRWSLKLCPLCKLGVCTIVTKV